MYCVSRTGSLAKALISDGVSGDKRRVFHQESKWFGQAVTWAPGYRWEQDKCV